jgi:hypothetical protein
VLPEFGFPAGTIVRRNSPEIRALRRCPKFRSLIWFFGALVAEAQEKPPLQFVATSPMPGFTSDFDHFGLDRKGNRLFLAAEERKTLKVLTSGEDSGFIVLRGSDSPS